MATEIATFLINEGQTVNDSNSEAGKILQETLKTVVSQKGCQRGYWGIEHENPGTLRLFFDWDSMDAHRTFTKTEEYKPFLEKFGKICALESGQIYHANPTPFPPVHALGGKTSPATELLRVYFPSNYSRGDQDKFDADFKKLLETIHEHSEGVYTGGTGGWIIEELELPPMTEAPKHRGEKFLVYFGAIGWKSVEHHLNYRTTSAFKKYIHLLREAKDLKHVEVYHYHGTEITA